MPVGLRSVWPLFVAVMMMMLGHGLQGSLTSVSAASLQFSTTTTGIVMAGFYVGLFVSSVVSPRVIGKVGHIRVFAAFASLVSTAVLLMPLFPDPVLWFFLRIIVGISIAGLSIVAESWLNAASSNENRGKMLSIYMIIAYAAVGLGQFLLNVGDTSGFVRFIIISALLSLALVPISLAPVQAPSIEFPRPVSLRDVYRLSPLAFVGSFVAGLAQSVFFSMAPVFGLSSGLSIANVSIMMAMPSLAVIFSQYPIGALSDRFDRRIVMMVLTSLGFGICLATLVISGVSDWALITALALYGGITFPIYSLALAHANDYLDADQMLGASAKLVLIYGCGAIIGPLSVGVVMQVLGASGFMIYLTVVHAALGVYAIVRMMARPDTPEETGDFIAVAPQLTPVAAHVVAEEYEETTSETPADN